MKLLNLRSGVVLAGQPTPLSDAQMKGVAGGQDGTDFHIAHFSFIDVANGLTANVSGTLNIATTPSSASISGTFSSSST
jgi:hypothetical protein